MASDGAAAGVLAALVASASQDPSVMKPASEQLQQWETQPGFFSIVSSVLSPAAGVADEVRLLAVMLLKNGVDKYWRRGAESAILDDEKALIRTQLLAAIEEPSSFVAKQMAVAIARIARVDVPQAWPDLIPDLIEGIKSGAPLRQQRALLYMYQTLKAMASRRLMQARQVFAQIADSLFPHIFDLWKQALGSFLEAFAADSGPEASAELSIRLEFARLALKCARQIFIHGVPEYHKDALGVEFMQTVQQQFSAFTSLRENLPGGESNSLSQSVDKTMVLLMKVLSNAHAQHPLAFVPFIQPVITLIFGEIFTAHNAWNRPKLDRTLNMGFVLVRAVINSAEYKPLQGERDGERCLVKISASGAGTEPISSDTIEAAAILEAVFSAEVVAGLVTAIVTKFLVLEQSEMERWMEEPEELVTEEIGDGWMLHTKSCAEYLLNALLSSHKAFVAPLLMDLARNATDTSTLEGILAREAVYVAIGKGAYDLFDFCDFDAWLGSVLVPELADQRSDMRILQRRILWLIEKWIPVKLSKDLRGMLFETLASILEGSPDPVVRLTAVRTLQAAVKDFDFKTEQLLPVLSRVFRVLCGLVGAVSSSDTKLFIVNAINAIIDQMGPEVRVYGDEIAQCLPRVWAESETHSLLQVAVVDAFKNFVECLGTTSTHTYNFVIPMIRFCVDLSNPAHVYLLDNALELWHMVLTNAPELSQETMQLYECLPPLLERGDESLRMCILILQSYIILGQGYFLETRGEGLVQMVSELLPSLDDRIASLLCKTIEKVFLSFPVEGTQMFGDLIAFMLQRVCSGDTNGIIFPSYIATVSRAILHNPSLFNKICALSEERDLASAFWTTLFDKIDSIGAPRTRKLVALSVASSLTDAEQQRVLLPMFDLAVNVLTACLHELHVRRSGFEEVDHLAQYGIEPFEDEGGTLPAESQRNRQLSVADPVYSVNLREFVSSQLSALSGQIGEEQFQGLLASVDSLLVGQMNSILDGSIAASMPRFD